MIILATNSGVQSVFAARCLPRPVPWRLAGALALELSHRQLARALKPMNAKSAFSPSPSLSTRAPARHSASQLLRGR
eukprot:4044835-Pyramimonas_sp.AAC.1